MPRAPPSQPSTQKYCQQRSEVEPAEPASTGGSNHFPGSACATVQYCGRARAGRYPGGRRARRAAAETCAHLARATLARAQGGTCEHGQEQPSVSRLSLERGLPGPETAVFGV